MTSSWRTMLSDIVLNKILLSCSRTLNLSSIWLELKTKLSISEWVLSRIEKHTPQQIINHSVLASRTVDYGLAPGRVKLYIYHLAFNNNHSLTQQICYDYKSKFLKIKNMNMNVKCGICDERITPIHRHIYRWIINKYCILLLLFIS